MKKVLFVIPLLTAGTSLVNAMVPEGSSMARKRRLYNTQMPTTQPAATTGDMTGADEDEVTGEEQEVTEAEENGY